MEDIIATILSFGPLQTMRALGLCVSLLCKVLFQVEATARSRPFTLTVFLSHTAEVNTLLPRFTNASV